MIGSAEYPRRFNKYVLVAPLARGGMGELHLALSGRADLGKLCVIKQIIGHLATPEYVQRFADETALVVKLSHGNLVPVFEGGTHEGQYFLVMEYIEGKDLRSVWNLLGTQPEGQRCPLEVALHITKEICRGLHYAHTFGDLQLVHRDVSPPNVLLSYTGEVKLTDFGLALSTIKLQKTAPGVLFGKLSYMSPEQARNEGVDARTDIYSAGIILWELVTGARLFPAEGNQLDQLGRAANPEIPPPSQIDPELPAALDLIVMRALAIDREARYPSAEAMRKELAGFLASIDPTTDSSALQRWLRELCGEQIDRQRAERESLLAELAGPIQRIFDESDIRRQATRPLADGESPRPVTPTARAGETTTPGVLALPPLASASRESGAAMLDPLPALAEGTVLGDRYRVDALLREGGMGTIYLATHTGIEKQVAVKVLHPMYTRMPEVVSRFEREAKATTRIGHPNIVEVHDSGTTEHGSLFIVMERLEGLDLADVLCELGQLDIDRALKITIQICQAVSAAHEAGVVHRDLKPENVFLTTREGDLDFVKVLDFGVAQMAQDPSLEELTNPGTPLGTPEYMAPEQAAGRECDHRADVYAVGVLLYEMLVGVTPDHGETMIEVLANKAKAHPVRPPRELRAEVPESLERIVLGALAYHVDQRPQSMAELAYELTKLQRGRAGAVASILGLPSDLNTTGPKFPALTGPDASEETESMSAGWRRWWPLWAGGVALTVALMVVLVLRSQPSATPPVVKGGATDGQVVPVGTAARGADAGPSATADASRGAGRAAGARPANAGPRRLLRSGRQHLRRGSFEKAQAAFESAQRKRKTRGAALTGLAELEFQRGRYTQAQHYAQQAVAAGGGSRAELILGNIHFKLRNYRQAVERYQRVLARDARHAEARRNLEAARRKLSR